MIVSQSGKIDSDSRALSLWDATLFQRPVAKLNYLAVDHPDIRYAASIIERFLLGRPTTWTHHHWVEVLSDHIMAYGDWAANRENRRSLSGRMLLHSDGFLRFWSRRQKAVSLSWWESELFASVSTGVEAFGLQSGTSGTTPL